ncbi:hypothetical protein B0J17DRAFT_646788 [Rhizoctonia solani]|nr:hypothetical protein B0J17DRAFT_646788 [Rhizoctonia solani]
MLSGQLPTYTLISTGGPGAPGKMLVTQLGDSLATSKIGGHFDIVAFDPRGTPGVKCFESRESKDQYYRNTVFELGYIQPPNATSDPSAFYDINMPNGGIEMKYMGTSSVARDIDFMATILDGLGAPINYWGQSYGSILGVYLFNMFPDRIGRGMIEGIANPLLWVTQYSHMWMDDWIQDADKSYQWFLDSCIKAGEARCAIAKGHQSPRSLDSHIEAFIDRVYARPMASSNSIVPAYLTGGVIRSSLYNTLLSPATWTNFTSQLQSAMEGDPAPLLNRLLPDPSRDPLDKAELARYAITCADSPQFNGTNSFPTPESLARNTLNRIKNISRYFGGSPGTTDIDGGCQFWPVDSAEKFTGPLNKTLANPILIVITPLSSAQLVHKLLGNSSRLITVNSTGHGVRFPSLCSTQATLAYFVNGTLPPNLLECQPEYGPFEEPKSKLATISSGDRILIDASQKVIIGLESMQRFGG